MKQDIVISDVHGRNKWERAVDMYPDAEVTFLGDYFDSFDLPAKQQLQNMQEIIFFARSLDRKVNLLLGNHDVHYLDLHLSCSGFQATMYPTYNKVFMDNIELFKACHLIQDEFLCSHAGISKVWLQEIGVDPKTPVHELVALLNEKMLGNYKYMRWTPGPYRNGYGDETCQSLTWIRPKSLQRAGIMGVTQVVGHTIQREGVVFNKGNQRDIWYTDAQDKTNEFLLIEDGVATVVQTPDDAG